MIGMMLALALAQQVETKTSAISCPDCVYAPPEQAFYPYGTTTLLSVRQDGRVSVLRCDRAMVEIGSRSGADAIGISFDPDVTEAERVSIRQMISSVGRSDVSPWCLPLTKLLQPIWTTGTLYFGNASNGTQKPNPH